MYWLYAITGLALVFSLIANREKTLKALKIFYRRFINILPAFLIMLILVSVVTRSKIARGISRNQKATLFENLIEYRVHLYPNSIPDSITDKGVNCRWDSGEPPVRDNVFFFLSADTVVLAVGAKNEARFAKQLGGLLSEVYPIGDCAGKRSIFAAIHGGSEVGQKI